MHRLDAVSNPARYGILRGIEGLPSRVLEKQMQALEDLFGKYAPGTAEQWSGLLARVVLLFGPLLSKLPRSSSSPRGPRTKRCQNQTTHRLVDGAHQQWNLRSGSPDARAASRHCLRRATCSTLTAPFNCQKPKTGPDQCRDAKGAGPRHAVRDGNDGQAGV